jgi:ketosteroid isomerase-like protein
MEVYMNNAKSILMQVLEAIPNGYKASQFFAKDGILELPFLHSLNIAPRYQGRQAIADFYELVKDIYPDFKFKPEDTTILIETPDKVLAEYLTNATARKTGRRIHHLFSGYIVVQNGQIVLLREMLNVVAGAQAIFPDGVYELGKPTSEIYSISPNYRS